MQWLYLIKYSVSTKMKEYFSLMPMETRNWIYILPVVDIKLIRVKVDTRIVYISMKAKNSSGKILRHFRGISVANYVCGPWTITRMASWIFLFLVAFNPG